MCGRSSLTKTEKEIEARFGAAFYSEELERYNPLPNFNVAPTHMMPVITSSDPTHLRIFRWGLIPFWAKNASVGHKMINARAETLSEKPAFRHLIKAHRCIVPLDGFYEWKKEGGKKIPYRVVCPGEDIYVVCGLWDQWKDTQTGQNLYSYTIITVEANKKMSLLHDRMPAILHRDMEKVWLDESVPVREVLSLLVACEDDMIEYYRVSDKVNSVRENNAERILPAEDDPYSGKQGLLF
jgi:putative SOS response-associated peptidase YedK